MTGASAVVVTEPDDGLGAGRLSSSPAPRTTTAAMDGEHRASPRSPPRPRVPCAGVSRSRIPVRRPGTTTGAAAATPTRGAVLLGGVGPGVGAARGGPPAWPRAPRPSAGPAGWARVGASATSGGAGAGGSGRAVGRADAVDLGRGFGERRWSVRGSNPGGVGPGWRLAAAARKVRRGLVRARRIGGTVVSGVAMPAIIHHAGWVGRPPWRSRRPSVGSRPCSAGRGRHTSPGSAAARRPARTSPGVRTRCPCPRAPGTSR